MTKKLTAFFILGFCGLSAMAQSGGPDAYGYTWKDNRAADGPTAEWFDLTDETRFPGVLDISDKLDDDNFFGPINFSFDFPYYWYNRSALYVGSNGYVGFNPNNISSSGGFPSIPVPGGSGDDYLAMYMSDLTMGGDQNAGRVLFYTDFKDTVIVSYLKVPFFAPETGAGANTFQVVLSRPDSGITFNYIEQTGESTSTSTDGKVQIGIENVSGGVGLDIYRDPAPTDPFKGASAAAPYTIRLQHPKESTFTTQDLTISWNNNPLNKGIFVPQFGENIPMVTYLFNQGLDEGPKSVLTGKVTGPDPVDEVNIYSTVLQPGEGKVYTYNGPGIPVETTGTYTFNSKVTYEDDRIKGNNSKSQMVIVVDTTQEEIELRYDDKDANGTTAFTGANYNSGTGTFIEPPFYPINITALTAGLSSNATSGTQPGSAVRVLLFDDDGINRQGERDGSPGTLLAQLDPLVAVLVAGENRFELPEPIQVNSGGVYIGVLQGGNAVGIEYDNTAPHSGISFEVINGEFVPFRNRSTQDPLIGMVISAASKDSVEDLMVSKIISPDSSVDYVDSVSITIELKNVGPKDVSGPFEVIYQINSRQEVVDTIPATETIVAGGSLEFTFKKKTPRPSAPKTRFESVCAEVNLANDFVPGNDKLCRNDITSSVSIEAFEKLNLFPNPSNEIAFVSFMSNKSEQVAVTVSDVTGKSVAKYFIPRTKIGFNRIELNTASLNNGLYLVNVQSVTKQSTVRMSVVK